MQKFSAIVSRTVTVCLTLDGVKMLEQNSKSGSSIFQMSSSQSLSSWESVTWLTTVISHFAQDFICPSIFSIYTASNVINFC